MLWEQWYYSGFQVNKKGQAVFISNMFSGLKMLDEGGQMEGRQIA